MSEMSERVEAAAQMFPVGTAIRYWPVMGYADEFEDAEVRSAPWELCGRVVLKITGRAGGVDCEHLAIRLAAAPPDRET